MKNAKEKKVNNNRAITLVSLIITIVILMILATVTIQGISGTQIVDRANEAKLLADYQGVNLAIKQYKLKKSTIGMIDDYITDKSLVGEVYKKVFVTDTNRELGIITDFDIIDSNPIYGNGGKVILEEDNNDMNTTKEFANIYELRDVYAVDLEDEILYYINGDQIYATDADKVEVVEDNITVAKYAVETLNQNYIERRKFITKWNVTLGETEGSTTYSTVVLPIYKGGTYDATIYWGDGTSTQLQHNVNGVTLTDTELIEKITHNYTLGTNDDGIKTIEISGTYSSFAMNLTTSTPTKLKLISLEQWGNTGFKTIRLVGCSNLAGTIPNPNKENCFEKCYTLQELLYGCTSITALEEGFTIPDGITGLEGTFAKCSKLTKLPESFKISNTVTNMLQTFAYSGLTKLPTNFTIPNSVTGIGDCFLLCSNLTELPENFKLPNNLTSASSAFWGCKFTTLPEGFTIPDKCTDVTQMFRECSNLTTLPEGFTLPSGITSTKFLFLGCGSLQTLPESFAIPSSVTTMDSTFAGCGQLQSLPTSFKLPDKVENIQGVFDWCRNLSLPEGFIVPEKVTIMGAAFRGCQKIKGTITIRANPTEYASCFGSYVSINSGGKLTVNYTKNCTNIEEIVATGDSNYVLLGALVD